MKLQQKLKKLISAIFLVNILYFFLFPGWAVAQGGEYVCRAQGLMYPNEFGPGPYEIVRQEAHRACRDYERESGFSCIVQCEQVSVRPEPIPALNPAEFHNHLAWCIKHEGVRVWDKTLPGRKRNPDEVRSECEAKQAHSPDAVQQMRLGNAQITSQVMDEISREVVNGDFVNHFRWAVSKIGVGKVQLYINGGNYEGLRWEYAAVQGRNPNARNLHAAVSNGYLRELLKTFFDI